MEPKLGPKYSEGLFSFLTTEHFTLQSARGIINQEISSRVSSFFMTVSSVLIASAFLAQLPDNRMLFLLFSAVAFPLLFFLGELTFMRMMQLSYLDRVYVRAISRVRRFYIDAAPEAEKYLLFPAHDDDDSINQYAGYRFSALGNLLSIALIVGMVNIVNACVLLGIGLSSGLHWTILQILPLALILAVLLFPLQGMVAARIVRSSMYASHLNAVFPAQPAASTSKKEPA